MISKTINTTIDAKLQDFLPNSIKKYWAAKQQVYISTSRDEILIKKISKPQLTLSQIDQKLKEVGKKVSKKDIKEAIKWARSQK